MIRPTAPHTAPLRWFAVLAVAVALAGCKVQAKSEDLARCRDPSDAVVRAVSERLTGGSQRNLRWPHLVASTENGWTWLSAEYAHVDDKPRDIVDIVTFASKTPTDPSSWVAAEKHAVDNSTWPGGRNLGIKVRDDGFVASRGCVAADKPKGLLE